MVNYSLKVGFPGVLDGIVQGRFCTYCRGTLGFMRFEKGNTDLYSQLICKCWRCKKEQSIEAEAYLVRR